MKFVRVNKEIALKRVSSHRRESAWRRVFLLTPKRMCTKVRVVNGMAVTKRHYRWLEMAEMRYVEIAGFGIDREWRSL